MFRWNNSFETGIVEVDKQHFHLVSLLNELNEEVVHQLQYDNYDKIMAVLLELKEYTEEHFSDEEGLMKDAMEKINDEVKLAEFWSYFKNHKKEHFSFVVKIKAIFDKDIDEQQEEISVELVAFLIDWLKNHILNIDQQLPNYIATQK
ncbi:bacteriohemerythrin [Alkaliphilus pronyensis]|uniref:Bacteriohemerythrin n=1 Tax=Alkaliphilus pronyensis TaxID=1482732 RepID=A0A6I0F8X4_9FIRM|nr:bacteriohemerythrin [Alkaliphilus pronyensis]KAB3534716.1 bacteriohemerythrin [Alkaliphilus pronyensis]